MFAEQGRKVQNPFIDLDDLVRRQANRVAIFVDDLDVFNLGQLLNDELDVRDEWGLFHRPQTRRGGVDGLLKVVSRLNILHVAFFVFVLDRKLPRERKLGRNARLQVLETDCRPHAEHAHVVPERRLDQNRRRVRHALFRLRRVSRFRFRSSRILSRITIALLRALLTLLPGREGHPSQPRRRPRLARPVERVQRILRVRVARFDLDHALQISFRLTDLSQLHVRLRPVPIRLITLPVQRQRAARLRHDVRVALHLRKARRSITVNHRPRLIAFGQQVQRLLVHLERALDRPRTVQRVRLILQLDGALREDFVVGVFATAVRALHRELRRRRVSRVCRSFASRARRSRRVRARRGAPSSTRHPIPL
mmetsp:Transcript_8504/g.33736  ORF Transcript_8504/g.33736 Transcript_8504/m.33736 type:complete len:366 (-) Transcript_8504:53-1150(-)